MAYNKFKRLEQLKDKLAISNQSRKWLPPNLRVFEMSPFLLNFLEYSSQEAITTEKAKSEAIIFPILRELRRANLDHLSCFSRIEFNIDKERELVGFCDFILSTAVGTYTLEAPIICLVEAKKGEIEEGIAQCGAEMYAAQIFNAREGNPRETLYGCVTNAFSWCFLKLNNKTLYIDPNYVPLTFTEPHRVLTTLQWILDEALGEGKS